MPEPGSRSGSVVLLQSAQCSFNLTTQKHHQTVPQAQERVLTGTGMNRKLNFQPHGKRTDLLHSRDGLGSTPRQLLHHQPQQQLQTQQQRSAQGRPGRSNVSASPAEPGSRPPSACRRPGSSLAQTRVQPAGGPARHLHQQPDWSASPALPAGNGCQAVVQGRPLVVRGGTVMV